MSASGQVQTTVDTNPVLGSAGELYDSFNCDTFTRIAEVAIPFGAYVVLTAGGKCKLPTSSANVTATGGGIALKDGSKAVDAGYAIGDPVTILHRGRVWSYSDDAATELTVPYIRYTAGTFNSAARTVGEFSGASDSGKNVQATDCRFWRGAAAEGLVVIEMVGTVTAGAAGATGATGATGPTGPTGP